MAAHSARGSGLRPPTLWVWAALIGCGSNPATAADAPQCPTTPELLRTEFALPRLASRLAMGQGARIVTIGSSSTAGAGASAPDTSYPAQLEIRLRRAFPGQAIEVINKGVNGEDAEANFARFSHDVLDLNPDAVIWQTGTNLALRAGNRQRYRAALRTGLARLDQADIDAVLMSPQFAPRFNDIPQHVLFVATAAAIAAERRVVYFDRYHIMKHWVENGHLTFSDILVPDGLHLNDHGYACVAEALTAQILAVIRR